MSAGPWGARTPEPVKPPVLQPTPVQPVPARRYRPRHLSVSFFCLMVLGVGIRAYRDLSRPDAWTYWEEQYFSPAMTSSLLGNTDLGGAGRGRPALYIHGTIGAASASWFRDRLDEAHLSAGDVVLISSPGGNLQQAVIMGETIRTRGLVTAVGSADASGHVTPARCASACVMAFAGGKPRLGVEGSALGVHRFTTSSQSDDPVAATQRTTGMILDYMTRMGVSSAVVTAMSATSEIRWLGAQQAIAMNLVTDPLGRP
jgi:hypothetical protein